MEVSVQTIGRAPLAVAIANGATTSPAFDTDGYQIVGLEIPSGWDGGATISFLAAEATGGTYQAVYDSAGTLITLSVAAGHCVVLTTLTAAAIQYLRYLQIVAAQAVGAARQIFVLRKQGA